MNQFQIYNDPKKFWAEISPELKKEEAKNNFLLGLSYLFQTDSTNCLYQSALWNKNELKAALVCSRYSTNLNLIPSPVSDVEDAQRLFAEFQRQKLPVTGIIGEIKTAGAYKKLFETVGKSFKIKMTQGIYRCKKVKLPIVPPELKFRLAEERDVEQIASWIEAFFLEAVPNDPPVNGREQAKTRIKNRTVYVLEKNSELVSMASFGRDIETSCSINLVYTPVAHREQGFASIITGLLTQHLLHLGKKETNLYTDMSNPTSNRIYQKIGYEFVCDSIYYGVI